MSSGGAHHADTASTGSASFPCLITYHAIVTQFFADPMQQLYTMVYPTVIIVVPFHMASFFKPLPALEGGTRNMMINMIIIEFVMNGTHHMMINMMIIEFLMNINMMIIEFDDAFDNKNI